MKRLIGQQAVVIGAGMAGLAAARAVADFVEEVVILERDRTPPSERPRPGVPQGRQPHLLMGGGLAALADLFPGFEDDLHRAGALPFDAGYDARCELPDIGSLPKREFGIMGVATTRPILEQALARRVAALDNVAFRRNTRALEILTTPGGAKAVGVCVENEGGEVDTVEADLVLDASGRAFPTMTCIAQKALQPPRETRIGIDLGYSTATFMIPPSAELDFTALVTQPRAPASSRTGYMTRIGGDRWQVLLVGRGDEQPPASLPEFLAQAELLTTSTIASALRMGRPVGEIAQFRFPESVWRHFGVSGRLPAGLVPIGDSICRFNPVYGQGMSVAALEARLLHELLRNHVWTSVTLDEIVSEFFARAEALIEPAWRLAALPDLGYPDARGERPADLEEQLRRKADLFRRAMHDSDAHRLLVEAQHLARIAETVAVA